MCLGVCLFVCIALYCIVLYILCKLTESHFTKSNSLFVQTYLANKTWFWFWKDGTDKQIGLIESSKVTEVILVSSPSLEFYNVARLWAATSCERVLFTSVLFLLQCLGSGHNITSIPRRWVILIWVPVCSHGGRKDILRTEGEQADSAPRSQLVNELLVGGQGNQDYGWHHCGKCLSSATSPGHMAGLWKSHLAADHG